MAQVRFIADLHFNHLNEAIRRGFASEKEMNDHIISQWNKVVHKKDITYILGDVTMEKKSGYSLLDELNGVKHVLLGNHDRKQDIDELLKYVNTVAGAISYKKNFILTHIPIHISQLNKRWKINIHGHVHLDTIMTFKWDYLLGDEIEVPSPKYFNVSCENINYSPISLEEIKKEVNNRII